MRGCTGTEWIAWLSEPFSHVEWDLQEHTTGGVSPCRIIQHPPVVNLICPPLHIKQRVAPALLSVN
jgi:hypothetical protein